MIVRASQGYGTSVVYHCCHREERVPKAHSESCAVCKQASETCRHPVPAKSWWWRTWQAAEEDWHAWPRQVGTFWRRRRAVGKISLIAIRSKSSLCAGSLRCHWAQWSACARVWRGKTGSFTVDRQRQQTTGNLRAAGRLGCTRCFSDSSPGGPGRAWECCTARTAG